MITDDGVRPPPRELDAFPLAFGQNLLARARMARTLWACADDQSNDILEDAMMAGPQGMLSLIRALIHEGPRTREELLREGAYVCGTGMSDLFEELLELFEGPDPLRDIWHVSETGHYSLTAYSLKEVLAGRTRAARCHGVTTYELH